jgi:hypothetical protein
MSVRIKRNLQGSVPRLLHFFRPIGESPRDERMLWNSNDIQYRSASPDKGMPALRLPK